MITPIYAAILALIFVALSIRTIRLRRSKRIGVGASNDVEMTRAMRVHANFAEYVPLALLLMFFLESLTSVEIWIHILGVILVVGRIIHAYGVSQMNENYVFRVTGMVLTFTVIISASLRILFFYIT